jgi:hypothetical protein
MKIKKSPFERKEDKNAEKFIYGNTNDENDIILISLRLQKKYVKKIDEIVSYDPFMSRNEWIVKNIMKALNKKKGNM